MTGIGARHSWGIGKLTSLVRAEYSIKYIEMTAGDCQCVRGGHQSLWWSKLRSGTAGKGRADGRTEASCEHSGHNAGGHLCLVRYVWLGASRGGQANTVLGFGATAGVMVRLRLGFRVRLQVQPGLRRVWRGSDQKLG